MRRSRAVRHHLTERLQTVEPAGRVALMEFNVQYDRQTKDAPTNANLARLAAQARGRFTIEPVRIEERYASAHAIVRMLPRAVARHFELPSLSHQDNVEGWLPERRLAAATDLCDAINAGLRRMQEDSNLCPGGDADLGDRPRTRGEDILAALADFRAVWPGRNWQSEFQTLEVAAEDTPMAESVAAIGRLLNRQRWFGSSAAGQRVRDELARIEQQAGHYHHVASLP